MLEYLDQSEDLKTCDFTPGDVCLLKSEKTIPMYSFQTTWKIVHQRGTPVKVLKIENNLILIQDADHNEFIVEKQDLFLLPVKFQKEVKILPYPFLILKWIRKNKIFRNFFTFYSDNVFELKTLLQRSDCLTERKK